MDPMVVRQKRVSRNARVGGQGLRLRAATLFAALAMVVACAGFEPVAQRLDLSQPGPYEVEKTQTVMSRTLPGGQTRTVQTHVWYPTKRDSAGQAAPPVASFPLVMFSHGSGASATAYSFFLRHLASHGVVAAGPDHQDCRGQCTDRDHAAAVANRPADVSMVLDGLIARRASDEPVFKNLIDAEQVGVAGHSFGGWTTLMALERDARFRAGLAMSPGTLNEPLASPGKVTKPLLLMAGVRDAMVPYALTARFFTDIPASAPERYLLTVQQAGHEFHDACLDGFVTTGCATSMPHKELQALANRVGVAFLLRHVAGRSITESELGINDASTTYSVVKAAQDAPSVAPTAEPMQKTPSRSDAPIGAVLLADNLNDPQVGRIPKTSTDPGRFAAGYSSAGYEITVSRPGTQGEVVAPGTYADVAIAVDVQMDDPIPGQFAQLACRSQDATSQYRFTFQPATGQVILVRWLPVPNLGVPRVSMTPLDLTSTAFRRSGAKDRAELICRGSMITARINGVDVASVSDNTFAAGQIWIAAGVAVGAQRTPAGPTARFSNLVITQE